MLHLVKLLILSEKFLVNINMKQLKYVFLFLIVVFTFSCKTSFELSSTKIALVKIDTNLKADTAIINFYAPYRRNLDSQMSAVLVYSEIELTKAQPESPLSNFFSDAITNTCKAKNIQFDFALPTTNGGIRTSLPKGAITRRHAFELMPFENELVVLTLKAESVAKLVEYIVDKGGQPVSDIQITAKKSNVPTFKIAGKDFINSGYYRVLTSDYLANGGDGIDAFKDAVKRENTNIKVRDAIIEYMVELNKSGKSLNPQKDGRIIIEQ